MITVLNLFQDVRVYSDNFWTTIISDLVEIQNNKGFVFSLTKYDKVEKFSLMDDIYKIIIPARVNFTAIGYNEKLRYQVTWLHIIIKGTQFLSGCLYAFCLLFTALHEPHNHNSLLRHAKYLYKSFIL